MYGEKKSSSLSLSPANSSSPQNLFDVISPVACYKLRMISALTCVIFFFSLSLNSLLLMAFYQKKTPTKAPLNIFIISLTVYNLVGSFLEFPFIIASNFYCRLAYFMPIYTTNRIFLR